MSEDKVQPAAPSKPQHATNPANMCKDVKSDYKAEVREQEREREELMPEEDLVPITQTLISPSIGRLFGIDKVCHDQVKRQDGRQENCHSHELKDQFCCTGERQDVQLTAQLWCSAKQEEDPVNRLQDRAWCGDRQPSALEEHVWSDGKDHTYGAPRSAHVSFPSSDSVFPACVPRSNHALSPSLFSLTTGRDNHDYGHAFVSVASNVEQGFTQARRMSLSWHTETDSMTNGKAPAAAAEDGADSGGAGSLSNFGENSSASGGDAGSHGGGGSGGGGTARTLKRPRLVWTPQLHKRFVDAVSQLGIKNAVPKTIMQLMNVDGLTRENVASHLQKYRQYLRRMSSSSSSHHLSSSPDFHLFAAANDHHRLHPQHHPVLVSASTSKALHAPTLPPYSLHQISFPPHFRSAFLPSALPPPPSPSPSPPPHLFLMNHNADVGSAPSSPQKPLLSLFPH